VAQTGGVERLREKIFARLDLEPEASAELVERRW
jgi:hypothetical protein